MNFRHLFFLSLFPFLTSGLLPELPRIPIPIPSPSPSILPSPSPDSLVASSASPSPFSSPSVSPSPFSSPSARPSASSSSPSQRPSGSPPGSPSRSPRPSRTPPRRPSRSPLSSPSPRLNHHYRLEESSSISTTPSPSFRCDDPSRIQPRLGRSEPRYAMAILGSAAVIGIASILYNGAYAWQPPKKQPVRRIIIIITARVLIILAIRLSAALVASITKESPTESALDASGVFLTWGSAVFLRLYYEGIIMTMTALGYMQSQSSWIHELRRFLNKEEYRSDPTSTVHRDLDLDKDPIWRGRWERKLLVLLVLLYFAVEISVLSLNVLELITSFSEPEEKSLMPGVENQCPLTSGEKGDLARTIIFQCLYALTYQPSLVPLLAICTVHSNNVRWFAFLVLGVWVVSVLALPHRHNALESFFHKGSLSLFAYVFFAGPGYAHASYIIVAIYTTIAAAVGVLLIQRLSLTNKEIE